MGTMAAWLMITVKSMFTKARLETVLCEPTTFSEVKRDHHRNGQGVHPISSLGEPFCLCLFRSCLWHTC